MKRLHPILLAALMLVCAFNAAAQCPPAATSTASLSSPAANASFPLGASIPFSWTAPNNTTNLTGYEVWMVQMPANAATMVCSTATTSCSSGPINTASRYEYFVRTRYSTCPAATGNDTARRTIFVGCPGVPSIVSPAPGAQNLSTFVTLQWSNTQADTYDVFLNTGSSCTALTPSGTSTGTTFSPPQLNAGTTYSWRVAAKKGQCSIPSPCATFTTEAANCPANGPALSAPADNASVTSGAVQLSWNAVTNATGYDIFVGIDGATPARQGSTTATNATITVTGGRTVRWFVTATAQGCAAKASSIREFTTPACPTRNASLTQPADDATLTNTNVSFAWNAVADAIGYDLFLSTNGGAFTQIFSTSTSTTGTRVLAAGSYEWYVRSRFGNACPATESERRQFTIAQSACPTDKPALELPADNASAPNPITFQWSAVPRATGYKLYALSAGATIPTLLGSTTTATRFTPSSLPAGALTWFVRALFEDCPETESARRALTVTAAANCPTTAPTLVAPANGASDVANPVLFRWNAVAGATRYRLMVSLAGASPSAVALTTDTQASISLPSAVVDWYVDALFDNCPATQSARFQFTTAASSNCPTNPGSPSIVSPVNGATTVASPVTLQWSAVTGATGYRVFASVNNTLVTLGTTTTTSLIANVPTGTIVWYVQALFGDCPSTLSARASFTVTSGTSCAANQPATLVSPAPGATDVTSPVDLRWNAVPGAVGYKVYVAVNNSSEFQLVAATSTETTVRRIIPAGIAQWYVDTQFLGCPDVRSNTARFTVVEANACPTSTITAQSPAGGATVASPVTFTWTAVADAASYRVWVSIDGSAPTQVARVNATTVTVAIPSGNVEWFAEALRTNCPSIVSPRVRFIVSAGSNCGGNQPPNLLTPTGTPAAPGTAASPVEFSWSATPNAIGYKVWVSINGQPFADIGFTTATTLRREAPAGTYAWYVDAFFAGCPSVQSARGAFTIAPTTPRCSSEPPTLVAAGSGTRTSSPVTFVWTSVPNAVLYRVYLLPEHSTTPILLGTTPETSLTRALPPLTGSWFVDAVFRDCNPTRSSRLPIVIPQDESCPTEPPVLVSPANGAENVTSPVDFIWNPVSGAVRYVVVVKIGDGAATAIGETTATQLTKQIPPGRVEWWIVALFANCRPLESTHFRFRVSIPPGCENNRRPLLLTPPSGAPALTSPVTFSWSQVARAVQYRVWVATGDLQQGASVLATTTATNVTTTVPPGRTRWFVEAFFDGCPSTYSAIGDFQVVAGSSVACRPPEKPVATVAGQVLSGTQYGVRWTPLPNITVYEVQESTTADFSNATTQIVSGVTFATFTHSASERPVQYLYRVRGVSACSDDRGPYSDVVSIFIVPQRPSGRQRSASAEIGTQQAVVQQIFLPGGASPVPFTATSDKEWIKITPASGTLPVEGITLTVTADPSILALGTNTGSVTVTYGTAGAGKPTTNNTTTNKYAVSVSLVTPVSPGGKNTPPDDALIIPAVAHAEGANESMFESDVRVTNLSAEMIRYLVSFTPSATDGTVTGSSSEIEIEPGATTALDDVLADFFGNGNASATTGTLEIRPISNSSTTNSATTSANSLGVERVTVASSRTFNTTPTGTFGQFVPAIPYSQFVGRNSASGLKNVLSLQQIAQSSSYRTNFGFVEASGEPAELLLRVFNPAGTELAQIPISLLAGEHKQLNQLLAQHNITLEDGRVEVEVTSDTGRVTAYASVLDAKTSDPLLVSPVVKSSVNANRYVIPGVADLNTGIASWRTDMRLFNAGDAQVNATLTYYPQANSGPPTTRTVALNAGEVRAIDNILGSLFSITNSGGSMVVTTDNTSSVVATARTYNQTGNGTYGQFIPGVTPAEAVGLNERTLQILQLEQSSRFRTNVGVTETTGTGATVEVYLFLPDSRVTPRIEVGLAPNEFRQFSLNDFGLGSTVYNARIGVRVIAGDGRVTAYGSVIDELTQDPTYVPAQ